MNRNDIIQQSFSHTVISDLLAVASVTPPFLDDTQQSIGDIESIFPSVVKNIIIDPEATRVCVQFFNEKPTHIIAPPKLKNKLGAVTIAHEVGHLLYTRDLLTPSITEHHNAPHLFTIIRVLEDIVIEKRLEQEYPATSVVFRDRAPFIKPIYSTHTPTRFAKQLDEIFLFNRGYIKSSPRADIQGYVEHYLTTPDSTKRTGAIRNLGYLLIHP